MKLTLEPDAMTKRDQGPATTHDPEYTLVYDGACTVCGRIVDEIRSWDRNAILEIVPSQAPGIHARFPWIPPAAYAESLQLIDRARRTWQGAAAVEQLLLVLPRGRWIAWIFRIPLVRPVAERAYRWFARNRYRLGCTDHCRTDFRGEA